MGVTEGVKVLTPAARELVKLSQKTRACSTGPEAKSQEHPRNHAIYAPRTVGTQRARPRTHRF